jgi:hypothetical protein
MGLAPEKASRIRVGDVGACTENRSLLLIPEPISSTIVLVAGESWFWD